jgi:predicted O-linked N-acetylglucosamine transferase (SPINDLY family)
MSATWRWSPRRGRRIRGAFDAFRDLSGVSDDAAAAQIAADGIDILVDLKGYTRNMRMRITTLRPAPVQVNWLGYPGTLGHPRLANYLIGDPFVTPPDHAARYSEVLALMPHCYQPNDRRRTVGPTPTRSQAGLPDRGFVFCSFNQSYKLTPEMFSVWCRLLNAVPKSILWLALPPTASGEANLRREAANRGVAAERLVFAPHWPLEKHLGRLQLADLVLDTHPYTSHTTASDALWTGVPLVTLMGTTFAGRVAASILHAAGLPSLVTGDLESYYELALSLASRPRQLAALKKKLATNRMTCPLFDSHRFTRNLEDLYGRMWQAHLSGNKECIVGIDVTPPQKRGKRPRK